eukprot:353152_1
MAHKQCQTSMWRNKVIIIIVLVLLTIYRQLNLNTTILDLTNTSSEPQLIRLHNINDEIRKDPHHGLLQKRITPCATHCMNPYMTHEDTDNPIHPQYERLDTSKLPNNWLSFANRCQLNKTRFIRNFGDFNTLWMNSKLGYLHNYKCGGSSVQSALHQLSQIDLKGDYVYNDTRRSHASLFVNSPRFLNESGWNTNPDKWYRILSHMFLFTFVRDPVDRFLSSFYEVHTRSHAADRIWSALQVSQYSGMQRMRKLLELYQENINEYMMNSTTKIRAAKIWKGEHHFHPQMLFLWSQRFDFLPFNYIGEMTHFDEAMHMIMDEFSEYFHEHQDEYHRFVKHLRNRQETHSSEKFKKKKNYMNVTKRNYYITRDELTDKDIESICEVYWADYICMPFEIPKQCNIQRLLDKYYGRFVTYNECYFS